MFSNFRIVFGSVDRDDNHTGWLKKELNDSVIAQAGEARLIK
jgi:hypothetical protein